ncbi:restriction endonuclease subunit S [Actinoallomurus sp. NPDC052308]|uniref:restriction endonuclease subunit S n=1 Tax=Actinoallomurus sp. NPDC052308 TaxID=3155530 RepID=UPI00341CB778
MSEWRRIVMDEFISLQRGYDLATPKRVPGNVPVIGAGGRSGWHDTAMVKGPGVVIGRAGASMGQATYSTEDFWPLNTSLFVTDFHGNDPRFVYYVLDQIDFSGYNSGAAQPMLNRNYIKQIPLSIPSLDEQISIAALLGALDDKVAINSRLVETIDELGAALFLGFFREAIDVLTVGSHLPCGWRQIKLEDAMSSFETGMRPRGGVARYKSGVPSVGAESIVGLARFDYSKVKYVPSDFYSRMKRGKLESHDILLYKDGGRPGSFEPHVALFGDGFPFSEVCINEHVYRIRLKRPFTQAFGYFWLSSGYLMDEMRRRGTGVAIPGLNSLAVKGLPIVQPPADRIGKFDSEASPLIDRALHAAKESRVLAELRDAMLPKLMSGEMKIRDAERAVEEAT